jgi:glycosyltransferase involved in cell wall biosynthesis
MSKALKITIVGLPLFAERLAENLSAYDPKNSYKSLNTYHSKIDKVKAALRIPKSDCVFSINGSIQTSKAFDMALKKQVPLILNWVGTDVVNAIRAYKEGGYRKEYITDAIHFCEVNWIQEELKEMGIEAEIVNFAAFEKSFELKEASSDKFTILSYIPEVRADFYGIDSFINLAKIFPEINFVIAGSEAIEYQPLPSNLKALGWVEDMGEIYDESHVTVRFPEHDGLSNFILESLARGKKVLYKYPFNYCEHCFDEAELEKAVQTLYKEFKEGKSLINKSGADFIESNFNSERILGELVERFKQLKDRK